MDKLEKAVEKARLARAGTAAARPVGHAPSAQTTAQPPLTLEKNGPFSREQEACFEAHRLIAHKTRSEAADTFRLLRSQILNTMAKENLKTLAITSPNYGDGKTTLALNLALSIALDLKQTVLLVDLDLRKPCVDSYLGLETQKGLTDFLAHRAEMPECLYRLPLERLSVLPAGPQLDRSSEALGSPQMAALANELKNRYDDRLIIYDMPPILAQDDPLAFLPHVDAVLLVVRDGETPIKDLKRCLQILEPANVIGTVLNNSL